MFDGCRAMMFMSILWMQSKSGDELLGGNEYYQSSPAEQALSVNE
jgi:hypothetical protein